LRLHPIRIPKAYLPIRRVRHETVSLGAEADARRESGECPAFADLGKGQNLLARRHVPQLHHSAITIGSRQPAVRAEVEAKGQLVSRLREMDFAAHKIEGLHVILGSGSPA